MGMGTVAETAALLNTAPAWRCGPTSRRPSAGAAAAARTHYTTHATCARRPESGRVCGASAAGAGCGVSRRPASAHASGARRAAALPPQHQVGDHHPWTWPWPDPGARVLRAAASVWQIRKYNLLHEALPSGLHSRLHPHPPLLAAPCGRPCSPSTPGSRSTSARCWTRR
jgi:hypothetical protein